MNPYCTPTQVMARLDDPAAPEPTVMVSVIEAVTQMIDRYFGYPSGSFAAGSSPADDTLKYFDALGGDYFWLDDMLLTATTLEIDEVGNGVTWAELAVTDYTFYPYNNEVKTRVDIAPAGDFAAWPDGRRRVRITGLWGIHAGTDAPADIREACIITAARGYKMGMQAFDDGARDAEIGTIIMLRGLHPTTQIILEQYPKRLKIL